MPRPSRVHISNYLHHRLLATASITAIFAVSLTVAAEAQYQLPPTVHQSYAYSPEEQASYSQPESQYNAYQTSPAQFGRRGNQLFSNGARSSSTFNFGRRQVAVQVDHRASEALINNYGGQHGAPGFKFDSPPERRILNQFSQDYQIPSITAQNGYSSNEYNKQAADQGAYTLTNPINGQKYPVNQQGWDPSAYNLNIQYNTQQQFSKPTEPSVQPVHNFHFNNGFPPHSSYLGQQISSLSNGFVIGRDAYNRPIITNVPNGQRLVHNPRFYKDYEVTDPNQPKIAHKIVYNTPQQTTKNLNEEYSAQINNREQVFSEVPQFESGKIVTKQEYVKNYTLITSIDEEVEEATASTPVSSPVFEELYTTPIPPDTPLPVVEDAKVKFLPTQPTIIQPALTEKQNQYSESLINAPEYSNLYRTEPQTQSVRQQTEQVPQNYNVFQPTTPDFINSALTTNNNAAPTISENPYYYQSTPQPQQQEYVFYQTTPSPESVYSFNDPRNPSVPNNVQSSSPLNSYEQTTEKLETLLSVNGFEETVTEFDKESLSNVNTVTLEQTTTVNSHETDFTSEQFTQSPEGLTNINKFEEKVPTAVNGFTFPSRNRFIIPTVTPSSRFTPTRNNFNLVEQTTPSSGIASIPSTVSIEHGQSFLSRKIINNVVHSSTPSYEAELANQRYVTEATIPSVSAPLVENTFVSVEDQDIAKKVKKVRVFKKPVAAAALANEEQLENERASKTLDTLNTLVDTERVQPVLVPQVLPDIPLELPQRIPSRFNTPPPHRLGKGNIVQPVTPRLRIRPTVPQLVSEPEQSVVAHTGPQYVQPTVSQLSQHIISSSRTTVPQNTLNVIQSPDHHHLSHLYVQPTHSHQSTEQVQPNFDVLSTTSSKVPDESLQSLQVTTTRTQSTVRHKTTEIVESSTAEEPAFFVTPTRAPESEQVTQRGRIRFSPQRPSYRSSFKDSHNVDVAKSGTYSLNGRLKVTDTANVESNEQPERRHFRYHAVKHSPDRQIIRRIKVKMNRKIETITQEDQDSSGSVPTTFLRNKVENVPLDKSIQERRVVNQKYRNSVLFPPRKPLRSHFGVRTTETSELDKNIQTDTSVSDHAILSTTEGTSPASSTYGLKTSATDKTSVHIESTTTRVTEKRQIQDDHLIQDLVNNVQNPHLTVTQSEGLQETNLFLFKELNLKRTENEYADTAEPEVNNEELDIIVDEKSTETNDNENGKTIYEESTTSEDETNVEKQDVIAKQEAVIPLSNAEDIFPSANPVQIVLPSMNPEQADPVTKIDIVTSISEMKNSNTQKDVKIADLIRATLETMTSSDEY